MNTAAEQATGESRLDGRGVVAALFCYGAGCLYSFHYPVSLLLLVLGAWWGDPPRLRGWVKGGIESLLAPTTLLAGWIVVKYLMLPSDIYVLLAVLVWLALSARLLLRWGDQSDVEYGITPQDTPEAEMPVPRLVGWRAVAGLLLTGAGLAIFAFAPMGVGMLLFFFGSWLVDLSWKTKPLAGQWPWSVTILVLAAYGAAAVYLPREVFFPGLSASVWLSHAIPLLQRWRRQTLQGLAEPPKLF